MKKTVNFSLLITSCLIVAAITFAISMLISEEVYNNMLYDLAAREQQYSQISELDRLVRKRYINNDSIDEDYLNDSILEGYVKGLNDPNSYYLTAEQHQALEESYTGEAASIGINPIMESGYILIIEVYKDSPAEAAGLLSKDLIVAIDGQTITKDGSAEGTISYETAIKTLSGEVGGKVDIVYRRDKIDMETELVKRVVNVPSVRHKVMNENTGYVRITEFNDGTFNQFNNAINELINTYKVNGIIFDVRNNSGGTLDAVEAVLDRILPKDSVITSYIESEGEEVKIKAKSDESIDIPMIVLVNESTASAAELFAVAIRDHELGEIVGSTTYGKGTMQTLLKLNDGSAVRLSVAVYKAPKSGSYDGRGVKPNYDISVSTDEVEYYLKTSFLDYQPNVDSRMLKAVEILDNAKRERGFEVPENVTGMITETPLIEEGTAVVEGEEAEETSSSVEEGSAEETTSSSDD